MNVILKALWFLVKMALLGIAALAGGYLVNSYAPNRIPWFETWTLGLPTVTLEQARASVEQQTTIVLDARPADDYEKGHLPMALSFPEDEKEKKMAEFVWLDPSLLVMTYCSGIECDSAELLSKFLIEQGITNLMLFHAGYEAWTNAGYDLEMSR